MGLIESRNAQHRRTEKDRGGGKVLPQSTQRPQRGKGKLGAGEKAEERKICTRRGTEDTAGKGRRGLMVIEVKVDWTLQDARVY